MLVIKQFIPTSKNGLEVGVGIGRFAAEFEIQKGIDELDAGKGIDGDVVFTELRERAKKLMESAE